MVLESTVICVDSSKYMRNEDYQPSRAMAQEEAVNLITRLKTRGNPESTVGLMSLSPVNVLAPLTSNPGKIAKLVHDMQPEGNLCLATGLQVARLILKNRRHKNHKTRIVLFVGSPIRHHNEKDLTNLAEQLREEKISLDIVSFGEVEDNQEILSRIFENVNGAECGIAHLVVVPPGQDLLEALIGSDLMAVEDRNTSSAANQDWQAMEARLPLHVDVGEEDDDLALVMRISAQEEMALMQHVHHGLRQEDDPTWEELEALEHENELELAHVPEDLHWELQDGELVQVAGWQEGGSEDGEEDGLSEGELIIVMLGGDSSDEEEDDEEEEGDVLEQQQDEEEVAHEQEVAGEGEDAADPGVIESASGWDESVWPELEEGELTFLPNTTEEEDTEAEASSTHAQPPVEPAVEVQPVSIETEDGGEPPRKRRKTRRRNN